MLRSLRISFVASRALSFNSFAFYVSLDMTVIRKFLKICLRDLPHFCVIIKMTEIH